MLVDAAAAKLLQSCPTLCDPIDGSPPGSPVPGILQARTLEWVAISFSNSWKVKVKSLSCVRLFATPWTAAYQAPPSMGFPGKSTGVGCHRLLPSRCYDYTIHNLWLQVVYNSVRTMDNIIYNIIYNIRSIISVLSTKLKELLLQVTMALMQKHLMPRWHRYHPEYRWSSLQWPGLPPIPERELPWAVFLTRDFL